MEKIDKIICHLVTCCTVCLIFLLTIPSAYANLRIISDEETETFLNNIAQPLFKDAQFPFKPNIFIVEDKSINAFASDGNFLFINTGTILSADSVSEIEGVMAHEVGHISGGHILHGKLNLEQIQNINLVSTIIAGAAGVLSGRPDVGVAIAMGGYSSTLNYYQVYRIEEERQADEAAVKLLKQQHKSPLGLLTLMKKIDKANKLSGIDEQEYFGTHPLTQERLNFLTTAVTNSKFEQLPNTEEFLRVQAKLFAFLSTPQQTFNKYPLSDSSFVAQYARAIAHFKELKINQALPILDNLLTIEPQNPFLHEMKAQILLETGNVIPAKEHYKTALNLLPNSALFKLNYAHSVLESPSSASEIKPIITLLQQSLIEKPTSIGWLLLARAFAELGQNSNAEYAAAEYSYSIGNFKTAKNQAEKAKQQSHSSALSLKIEDLLTRLQEEKI